MYLNLRESVTPNPGKGNKKNPAFPHNRTEIESKTNQIKREIALKFNYKLSAVD
jgi:hypothetical protein